MHISYVILTCFLLLSCNTKEKPLYSFKLNDYEYQTTHYNEDKVKIVDIFVNKYNKRLTLRKYYYDNDSIRSEIFYLNEDKFGPFRLYDPDGTLAAEIIHYGKFDSIHFTYDKVRQVMEKNKK